MLVDQLEAEGIDDPRVLKAIARVPRHEFVPAAHRSRAYDNRPLPIGHGQTISQPYIVAAMTSMLKPEPTDVILEIGTGSGYQAAVLSHLVKRVYSMEIISELAERAQKELKRLGYANVEVVQGNGYAGLPAHAPYDGIIVTAAPHEVPEALVEQLAVGGRMVIPVGEPHGKLMLIEKTPKGLRQTEMLDVLFVPMTGDTDPAPRAPPSSTPR